MARSACDQRARKRNHGREPITPWAARESATARTAEPGGIGARSMAPDEEQERRKKGKRKRESERKREKRRGNGSPFSLLHPFPFPILPSPLAALAPLVEPLLQDGRRRCRVDRAAAE